jgi:hypothetical protein
MFEHQDDKGRWHPTSGVGDQFGGYQKQWQASMAEQDARRAMQDQELARNRTRREQQGSSSGSTSGVGAFGVCAIMLALFGACAVIFVVGSVLFSR